MPKSGKPSHPLSFKMVFLQLAALSALGIGQPLLQMVAENPQFLVVHQSRGADIIILALVLLLAPPVLLGGLVFGAGLVRPNFGRVIHSLVLGGLLSLVLLPMVDRIPAVDGWVTLALAIVPSMLLFFRFGETVFLKKGLTYFAVVLPVFLVVFLGSASVRAFFVSDEALPSSHSQSSETPVVLIVFDEFPTTSLMNPDLELDCQLFPNFCRLAEQSTWYRNATTISGATLRSVPTIMTGKFPSWKAAPSLAAHPQNIFTLLAASHQITSYESQTSLCPDELKSGPIPGLLPRLNLLFSDLSVLYEHILVPETWRDNLIPVSNKWNNFRVPEKQDSDGGRPVTKIDKFNNFVSSIERSTKPQLVVAHTLLPHNPFKFFPDGTIYNWRKRVPTESDGTWGPDSVMRAHSYRRHILQVVAVDRLLGNLLDRLEDQGIFEDAVIVVTADHGACFREGLSGRHFNDGNEADIMSVPLFLKMPGQASAVVDDRLAQTVDIMPTLVSALGMEPGWNFDGMDLLNQTTDRTELDFKDQDTYRDHKVDPVKLQDRHEVIQWKRDLFGENGGYERLFSLGDTHELIGTSISGLQVKDHHSLHCEILDEEKLEHVNIEAHFVPAELNGFVLGHKGQGPLKLALALNGTIAGVSETYLPGSEPGVLGWQITTSLSAFQNGANKADLFLVTSSAGQPELVRILRESPSFLGVNVGGRSVSGIGERGLFSSHKWDGQWARWTDGNGQWDIPLNNRERPKYLDLAIVSSGPSGTSLTVVVNGIEVLTEELQRGRWEASVSLENIPAAKVLAVELKSGVFIPAEKDPNSSDQRELGVAITTLVVQ